ncbi:MAG: thiol:disulfide interchange protein DsbA/DsbL [Halioglobus sp.]|jgi:thiol:disulfide interchange protein DsbA|nr:thiol:disulfide interchange protein DsbA/DsbL [Halioglobus sp.]
MIKRLLLSVSLMLFGLSCAAAEDGTNTYEAGTHYALISPPVRTLDSDTIEVAEFFWYGCSHCYSFEPVIRQWEKTMPEGVSFRGIPAVWRANMQLHARAYFTAEVLGVLDTMNPVIFQAMNVDRKPLASEGDIAKLFVANGVSEEDFSKTFGSFGVTSQVNQAISTGKGAKLTGTPALMVDGKYLITGRMAGGQADMLKVADFLVEKERAAKGS